MSIDPRAYYDKFSVSYNSRRGYGYHALIDELEADVIPQGPSLRILEAGCGTGLLLGRLRARGNRRLFGIDLSSGMLAGARGEGNAVAQASVTALPFPDNTFDVVYSFKVLAHVPDIVQAMAEFARVVRPGGTIVAEFYNRHSLRGLRWRAKHLFGGETTGASQRETELFTRYDSLKEMKSYMPSGVEVQSVRGVIVVTPAAAAMNIPGLGAVLEAAERRLTASSLAGFGGFAVLVARRL
jgi:ubiquinone/menaquinone biosynthesis C-methylase UbiE